VGCLTFYNDKMKKLILFISLSLLTSIFLTGCSGCSSRNEDKHEPVFVKADTVEVLKMAEEYLHLVQAKDYDKAMDMLYDIYPNDSVAPISQKERDKITAQHRAFPVLDFHVADLKFVDADKVRVTYSIEFFKKDPNDSIQNTVRFSFAPERINSVWYLQVMDVSEVK